MPLVGALVEVDCDDRAGIEIVARPDRTVERRRRAADDEEDGSGLPVDGRCHGHAATQRLVELATLFGQCLFFRGNVAVHVAARRVERGPDAFVALVGDREERPQQVAVGGAERLDEAANSVHAAVGTDQHLAVGDRRRHGDQMALFRVGNRSVPQQSAGPGIQRHESGVDRAHEQPAALDRNAAVVVATAGRHDRPRLVPVLPELLARRRVDRVDMIERRGQEHDAVDNDRRRPQGFQQAGLEHESRPDPTDIPGIDMGAGVMARLLVTAVRVQPVLRVAAGSVEHRLRRRRVHRHRLRRHRRPAGELAGRDSGTSPRHDGHHGEGHRGSREGHGHPCWSSNAGSERTAPDATGQPVGSVGRRVRHSRNRSK